VFVNVARMAKLALTATVGGLIGVLVASSTVLAAPDPLSSGSVTLQLRSSGGLKLKPGTRTLTITTGNLDPTTGAGTLETRGAIRAKRGKRKTKVKITALVLGANGGPGKITARIGKKNVGAFGKLSGGTVTRDGWGARVDGVTATLGSKGAKALTRAFSPRSGKKSGTKASTAAARIKGGKPLGTVSVTGVPRTVEVLPGGTLTFTADTAVGGFAFKLIAHCVSGLSPGGIGFIPPAVQSGPLGEVFTFPVTGGSIAPDFTAGRVTSAGGQTITKNNGLGSPLACASMEPPVGTTIIQSEWEAQFELKALAAFTTLPTGPVGIGSLGPFDLTAATTSADVNTKQITVTDAPVTLDGLSAFIFNQVFPNASGDPNNDFMEGDLLGTLSLSVTTH
jgi:hypothetical protein